MRELAILTFLTLDGVMQGPSSPKEDPSGGFTRGGWANDFWGPVMSQVKTEAMDEPYEPLFGRKTYDMFAAHWPTVDDDNPVGYRLNNAKKYVVTTSTEGDLPWKNSTRVTGDIVAEIERLKEQDGPLLQVHGSGNLIQTLLEHDMIDEFRLWTFPVLVGQGKRLFNDGGIPANLELVKTEAVSNGVVMAIYRRSKG